MPRHWKWLRRVYVAGRDWEKARGASTDGLSLPDGPFAWIAAVTKQVLHGVFYVSTPGLVKRATAIVFEPPWPVTALRISRLVTTLPPELLRIRADIESTPSLATAQVPGEFLENAAKLSPPSGAFYAPENLLSAARAWLDSEAYEPNVIGPSLLLIYALLLRRYYGGTQNRVYKPLFSDLYYRIYPEIVSVRAAYSSGSTRMIITTSTSDVIPVALRAEIVADVDAQIQYYPYVVLERRQQHGLWYVIVDDDNNTVSVLARYNDMFLLNLHVTAKALQAATRQVVALEDAITEIASDIRILDIKHSLPSIDDCVVRVRNAIMRDVAWLSMESNVRDSAYAFTFLESLVQALC